MGIGEIVRQQAAQLGRVPPHHGCKTAVVDFPHLLFQIGARGGPDRLGSGHGCLDEDDHEEEGRPKESFFITVLFHRQLSLEN